MHFPPLQSGTVCQSYRLYAVEACRGNFSSHTNDQVWIFSSAPRNVLRLRSARKQVLEFLPRGHPRSYEKEVCRFVWQDERARAVHQSVGIAPEQYVYHCGVSIEARVCPRDDGDHWFSILYCLRSVDVILQRSADASGRCFSACYLQPAGEKCSLGQRHPHGQRQHNRFCVMLWHCRDSVPRCQEPCRQGDKLVVKVWLGEMEHPQQGPRQCP